MQSRTDTLAIARRNASHKTASKPTDANQNEFSREIPVSTPSYNSFAHIRDPKVREAKNYEQHLLILRDMYPQYSAGIETQIAYARSQQERSCVSDRDRVIKQLEACALSCREVADDLSIPYATAYKILQEFAERGAVAITQRAGRAGNKPVCYYSLAH